MDKEKTTFKAIEEYRYDLWKTVSEHLKDVAYKWHTVDKWITQGSLSGPHLFNLFINDLAIRDNELTSIVKYADDTTLPVKVCKNELKINRSFSRGCQSVFQLDLR